MFSIEDFSCLFRGEVMGRRVLGVRICSCPKRDKERLERDLNKGKKTSSQKNKKTSPAGSKRKVMLYSLMTGII